MARYRPSDFKNGNIPNIFREEYQILAEPDPAAEAFNTKMQAIYARLLEGLDEPRKSGAKVYPGLGKSAQDHPVRFLLSASKTPNAFILSEAEPPVVVFTAGMVALCEKEAHLAGVLGHELGHKEFQDRLGVHRNGKGEEGASDIFSVSTLRDAHYEQTGLQEVLQKLPEDERQQGWRGALDDVHPLTPNRLSALGLAAVGFDNRKGKQESPDSSSLDGQFKSTVAKAYYETRVDRLFREKNYDTAGAAEKMQIIREVIKESEKFSSPLRSDAEGIRERIQKLSRQSAPEAFDNLVDYIVQDADRFRSYYSELVKAETGKQPPRDKALPPIGRLRAVQAEITRFTKAATDQNICDSAERIEQLLRPYANSSALLYIGFKGFSWPTNLEKIRSPQVAPWDNHVLQALNGNEPVLHVLERLGIRELDPRLEEKAENVAHITQLDKAVLGTHRQYRGNEGHTDAQGHKLAGEYLVEINEQGRITGLKDIHVVYAEEDKAHQERKELAAKREKQLAVRRETEERKLLSTMTDADWALLNSDFDAFVEKYKAQLTPYTAGEIDEETIHVTVEGKFPFAEAFLQKAGEDVDNLGPQVKTLLPKLFRDRKARGSVFVSHPFVQFACNDPHDLFTVEEKLDVVQFVHHYNRSTDKDIRPKDRWLLPNEKLFEGLPKKTLTELREWTSEVSAFGGNYDRDEFLLEMVQYEALRTTSHLQRAGSIEDVVFLQNLSTAWTPMHHISDALTKETARLTANFAKTVKLGEDPSILADEFIALSAKPSRLDFSIFEHHPSLRQRYQEAIQKAYFGIEDPQQKREILEKLLFRKKNYPKKDNNRLQNLAEGGVTQYEGALSDPDFKEWAIHEYADILTDKLGKDDASSAYTSKFKVEIDLLAENTTASNAITIMQRLGKKRCGNRLLLREASANYLKESVSSVGMQELVNQNLALTAGEGVFEKMKEDAFSREASIRFLTEPFTPESGKEFSAALRMRFPAELSEEARTEKMASLHRNFWSMPFEARSIAMQQVLFPDSVTQGQDPERINSIIKKQALDKVFPLTNGRQTLMARKVVESYLEATNSVVENSVIGAAMLVANPPNGDKQGKKLSVGKGLRLVLGAIDPAGDKVAQAIESHPNTPAQIKVEFRDSKTAAQDPMRHEVLEWVKISNDALKYDGRSDECLVEVGRVLGAGSYGITVEGKLSNGATIARTLLYPHVRERAEMQFETLEKAADILVKRDKRFAPVKDMIRQASRMSGIETDMDIAAKQAETADKLYSGLKVIVDGEEFSFSAAKYLGHGHDHKDFEIIPGDHFNDVADAAKTEAEKERVVKLARAQMAAELSHILSGRPFDHDRHGGQQRIVGNNIGQFDFGAMTVTETSDREKQMIGHVIGGMIWLTEVKGRSMDDALRTEMSRVPANEEEKDFLASVERAILALGNFNSHLGGMGFGDILGAIYTNNQIDPIIKQGIEEALPSHSDRVFEELEKKGKESGIQVAIQEQSFDKNPNTTPLGAPPKKGWLEKTPLKDNHLQAGAGVVAAAAGAGALYHSTRQKNGSAVGEDKEQSAGSPDDAKAGNAQKRPIFQRVYSVCAAALTALGSAIAIDGLAFQGRGTHAVTGFARNTIAGDYNHRLGFSGPQRGTTIMMGAAVFGLGAALLLAKKQHEKKQISTAASGAENIQHANSWTAREQNRTTGAPSRQNARI